MFSVGSTYGVLAGYGSLNLTDASPPQSFTEPLTLEEVQSYLKIPTRAVQDDEEKSLLGSMISAARELAEILQNRDLIRKQWDLSLDYWPSTAIKLRAPLVSVDSVQYRTSDGAYVSLAQDTDFVVDSAKVPGVVMPLYNQIWTSFTPWPSSAIVVRFTSGYSPDSIFWQDAGARIRIGMRLLISAWFHTRLPFDVPLEEIPYAITACLSYGANERAR